MQFYDRATKHFKFFILFAGQSACYEEVYNNKTSLPTSSSKCDFRVFIAPT